MRDFVAEISEQAREVVHVYSTATRGISMKESSAAQAGRIFVGFYPNLLTVDLGTSNVDVPVVFKNAVTQFHL